MISTWVEVGFVGFDGLKDNEEDGLNDIGEEILFDLHGEPYTVLFIELDTLFDPNGGP